MRVQTNIYISKNIDDFRNFCFLEKDIWKDIVKNLSSNRCDIRNGNCYKEIMNLSSTKNNVISLLFNCDGVQLYKSSATKIWPLYAVVNELSPNLRYKNSSASLNSTII